jgi:hypothetical protein
VVFHTFRTSIKTQQWTTWFSPDALDGFRVANTFLKEPAAQRSTSIFVHACRATRDWQVFEMAPLEADSLQSLRPRLGR